MNSMVVKLNRLQRMKPRKFRTRNPKLEWYLTLYWRYWHRVYGKHIPLWDIINEGVRH